MSRLGNIWKNPDGRVITLLALWLAVNLLQSGFTELADDEAYYVMFAEKLEWGYFDHPPMTALMIWLGTHIFGGEFGVRFFFTLLQPAYLWILWKLVRPERASAEDGSLFAVIAAATLMLQLYGFLAVPDAPLMFSASLYLLAFDRFCKSGRYSWAFLGFAMALMAYSKYHGALLVLFSICVNPRLLRRPQLYLAGLLAAVLIIPHLFWQYNHDWASFAYHLSGRNATFDFSYLTDYIANMLVVFNPLLVPVFCQAWHESEPHDELHRTLRWLPVLFISFFMLSSCRGYVQPQWVIVASFGILYVMFCYVRSHPRTRRYVMWTGLITIVLVMILRIEMMFNPLDIRYEIFDNETSYPALARAADGRPVIFNGHYAVAAKYRYYAGAEAFCEPKINYRTHQWQFRDDDSRFEGREVLVMCDTGEMPSAADRDSIVLPNGEVYHWFIDSGYHPVRLVNVKFSDIPKTVRSGDVLDMELVLENPYSREIAIGDSLSLVMVWKYGRFDCMEYDMKCGVILPAHGTAAISTSFELPTELSGRKYDVGFALERTGYTHWFNGKALGVEVK